jgi:hypothetical protein
LDAALASAGDARASETHAAITNADYFTVD